MRRNETSLAIASRRAAIPVAADSFDRHVHGDRAAFQGSLVACTIGLAVLRDHAIRNGSIRTVVVSDPRLLRLRGTSWRVLALSCVLDRKSTCRWAARVRIA